MYLKQIELENFKSFGGKVTVPLMDGYMAVTGPNGSGKSNIGDAILFVLGPKSSKAVRAGRITDLIFSGGTSKAKANFMKVSLVFDNSDRVMPWDADIVRLTRYVKLSPNGQDYSSYFFVNDNKSSLSEFDALLTKARISADGYNIVQQGDVTHIVRMGNLERRRILDGISGIASFDADISKAQTEKAGASENLNMIGIISGEKEKQLRSLSKDKEQAQIYLAAKKDLDVANAQMTVRRRDNEQSKLNGIEGYIAGIRGDIETLTAKKASVRDDQAANENAVTAKEGEIEARAGPEYMKIRADVEQAKINVATEKDRQRAADEDKVQQLLFRQGFEESVEDNRNQYRTMSESLNDLNIQFDSASAEQKEAKDEEKKVSDETSAHGGEITDLQKRLDALDGSIDAAGTADQAAQAEAASAKAVSDQAQRAKADADEALQAAKFDVKDADWNLGEVTRAAGPDAAEDLSKKILDLKGHESGLEKQESEMKSILERRTAEFNRLSAEKRISDSYNSLNVAVSRVMDMKQSGQIRGIRGTVAELATVEPGYEVALGIAAGGKMNAVVVDDDSVAAQCIEYLKSNKLGRVTFLPISKMMPGKPRAKAIMSLKSTEGYATDFITYDPIYANVFWYVFQDTMVVSSMDQARAIMGGIRLVTKAGELIEASGAMVGGTVNKKSIPQFGAGGESELQKAGEDVRQASDALDAVRAKLREIRDQIRETDDKMREASAKGIGAKANIAAANAALEQAKKAATAAEQALAERTKECAEAEKASADAASGAVRSAEVLSTLRNERSEKRTRMSEIAPPDLQERIQKIRDKVYKLDQAVSGLRDQIGGAKAELSGLDKQKEALEIQIAEVDRRVDADVKASAEHSVNAEKFAVDLEAMKSIESEMEAGMENLKAERDVLIERRYALDSELQKVQTEAETKDGILQSQVAQAEISKQNLAGLSAEMDAIQIEIPEPIPSEETLKRTVRECQGRIDGVGNVNLRAIEDYDVMKKEYDDLQAQTSKLQSQIADLDKLTEDLSSKKKGLFMEAYSAVDRNFRSIYAELSGGGEGYMALDDPDDPFNGGLQLNAKPRNGKMLRLEALSGGETSLTALSFIFAIQEYQPSPFYVLDEVDMFLDSVNTELVARRVKQSSAKAQFIQVSLRKVALMMADHLIGVTRPPSGISRIIMQPDLDDVSKYEEEALKRQKPSDAAGATGGNDEIGG